MKARVVWMMAAAGVMACAAQAQDLTKEIQPGATPTKPDAKGSPEGGKQQEMAEGPALPAGVTEVARSERVQLTGVAVSKTGRVFVCSPNWHEGHTWSVAEVKKDGTFVPYPDEVLNGWRQEEGKNRGIGFVCVQALWIDEKDNLWVVDAGSPKMAGTIQGEGDGGGAKLVRVSLEMNRMIRPYPLHGDVVPQQGYLNDARVDITNNIAWVTDSGAGAIVQVDLRSGRAKRLFDESPLTKADQDVKLSVNGKELRRTDGSAPMIHADGIAWDKKNGWLYFQPLTGRTLHRVKTSVLLSIMRGADDRLADRLAGATETVGETVATDGMIMDGAGNLYFTAIEKNAIMYRSPDGAMHTLVEGEALQWPDSFAIHDGELYFTTSQINLTSWFSPDGSMPRTAYRVLKVKLPGGEKK